MIQALTLDADAPVSNPQIAALDDVNDLNSGWTVCRPGHNNYGQVRVFRKRGFRAG